MKKEAPRRRTWRIPHSVSDPVDGVVAQHNLRSALYRARKAGYTKADLVREVDRAISLASSLPTNQQTQKDGSANG